MWSGLFRTMMERLITTGTLDVHLPDGSNLRFGDGLAPAVAVRVENPVWIGRLVRNPELALGEAYMHRGIEIDGDDLHGLLQLLLANHSGDPSRRLWWQNIANGLRMARRRLDQRNGLVGSVANVRRHYDLSSAFYDLFLDEDRQYSCAYFDWDGQSLEQAQQEKKRHIARKLLLRPGMHVLDIGCGWGGLALTLAQDHDVRVTGITLSAEQHEVAQTRLHALGLQDRVTFRLMDYRNVAGRFDRIVSVGMFEHVGLPNYRRFFATLRRLLTDDGVALVHTIGRATGPGATNPFIARHIFPGGYVPAMSEVLTAIEDEALWMTDMECLRLHYAKTLRHWLHRFDANQPMVRALYDDAFARMWRFYLIASEQGFVHGRQAVYQIQLSRQVDAVPITRDYLYSKPAPAAIEDRMAAE